MTNNLALYDAADFVISEALRKGADAAESKAVYAEDLTSSVRMGKTEKIESSTTGSIDLRFLKNKRQVIVSSSDLSKDSLERMVARASEMVMAVPASDLNIIVGGKKFSVAAEKDLEVFDPKEISVATLTERAKAEEDAALSVAGITNSDGADAGIGKVISVMLNTKGFSAERKRSYASISVSVIAGEDTAKETDYAAWSKVYYQNLPAIGKTGQEAASRTLRRLNGEKIASGRMPVVFEPRIAASLLGHFAAAVNGQNVVKGLSFLQNKMGDNIFASNIDIVDNPRQKRGLRSRAFDDEGTETRILNPVKSGILTSWLLDWESASQLKLNSTGHAKRGIGAMPHPAASNLFIAAGKVTPEELIKDIKHGLLVTDLFGQGVNIITGDYSRGACGFLVQDGEITTPVNEITIAGNLADMFKNLQPANDLELIRGMDSPTLRIEDMSVSGN